MKRSEFFALPDGTPLVVLPRLPVPTHPSGGTVRDDRPPAPPVPVGRVAILAGGRVPGFPECRWATGEALDSQPFPLWYADVELP